MPILLPLLLLYYGAASIHCSTVHENSRDLQALLDCKQGIRSDPNGALSNWTISSHFCQWNGVKCTPTPPLRVTDLILTGQKLSGQISSSLGNLTFLENLDLSNNNFVGPVPLLGSLQQLLLSLYNNNLSGNIPDALASCSNLTVLDLSSNLLVGSIPPKLGILSKLEYLSLQSNQLEGSIPGELGQLKLTTLILSNNKLSDLSLLNRPDLSYNLLQGEIPNNGVFANATAVSLKGNRGLAEDLAQATENISMFNLIGRGSYSAVYQGKLTQAKIQVAIKVFDLEIRFGDKCFVSECDEVLMAANQPAKLAVIAILPLLLLSYGVSNAGCSTIPDNSTDVLSLLDFKHAITDPTGALNSWNSSVSHCLWKGVKCSLKHPGRVTELSLGGLGLAGPISPSIGNLTFLETLNLTSNSLSGELPPLTRFHKLQNLVLAHNSLQGVIPDAITNCSKLNYLDLSSNYLTGEIPRNIGLFTNLSFLFLSVNNLTGTIPPSLKNLSQLKALWLNNNRLTGTIPDGLGQLLYLLSLNLGANNLSGGIPGTLFNRSSPLYYVDLSFNMLGNTLPSDIGDTLPQIQTLYLGYNMFEGNLPASLGNASELASLDLPSHNFTGQVPRSLGKHGMLAFLNLQNNKLEANDTHGWEFIDTLSNSSSLQELALEQNQFQGAIPNSIGKLQSTIQQLGLGYNDFTGAVPNSIGNLTGLTVLDLRSSNLNGLINRWVGKLKDLQGLYLSDNYFVGTIPPSISNLTHSSRLDLANNKFTGLIPPSLGNLLPVNNLNLSNNNFRGSIPVEFGNLKQLVFLDVSSYQLCEEIPETLGQCQQLVTIRMDQNILTGNIPTTFSNLNSLSVLNLSHNILSGPLPAYLDNLQLITKLDLSYNNFEGEIPRNSVLDNATVVSLDGNTELCGGAIHFNMPPCQVVSRRAGLVSNLIKTLISMFGFMSLITLAYTIFHAKKKTSRRPYLLLFSFGKHFPKVSYKDIVHATGNFCESNLIGRGSYGSVYKGKITQATTQVAIKVFDLEMRCADRSFISECEVLRSIRHRNLLPILTACSTIDNSGNNFKALIYELMQNGNLDTWLHHRTSSVARKRLGLVERMNIAVSIADALAYLHHDCGSPIVHCDVKPTNILLDDDMNAHLGDFGIASLVLDPRSTTAGHSGPNSSVIVTGTIGYIAPEYGQSVHVSTSGDVYSFGIVLLEMLVGKRPTDSMFGDELSIVCFAETNFPDQMFGKIDARLQEECKGTIKAKPDAEKEICRCLQSLVQVALSCTRLSPRQRMNMREVAINLHAIRRSYVAATKRQ
ncbi:hypothetical protein U9M48_022781 [Paspalum notatum var. saurae]|uniref:Receptor kinase-like protein Xa21 n=1 Tax=Paspalum notatum var. saurae TaxID=547442 RepID=A0AAQ3WV20_PASNO